MHNTMCFFVAKVHIITHLHIISITLWSTVCNVALSLFMPAGYLSSKPAELLKALLQFACTVVESGAAPSEVLTYHLPNLFGPGKEWCSEHYTCLWYLQSVCHTEHILSVGNWIICFMTKILLYNMEDVYHIMLLCMCNY